MENAITIQGPLYGVQPSEACQKILGCLPEWFGIESAVKQFVIDAANMPGWLAMNANNETVGFVSIHLHNPFSAEVHVMGVLPQLHHHGIGRKLMSAAEAWLCTQKIEYLQVKTLAPSDPDPGYTRTRAFYTSIGFRPLEETTLLWGTDNPCLIMVKRLMSDTSIRKGSL